MATFFGRFRARRGRDAEGIGLPGRYTRPVGRKRLGRPMLRSSTSRDTVEAHLSTEQPEEEEDPRVPYPHEDPGRPAHPRSASDERQVYPLGVVSRQDPRWSGGLPLTRTTASIRKASELGIVRRRGKRYEESRVVVYVLPSEDWTRIGFVSSRNVGGAVARNRARRLLKAAWRGLAPRVRSNYDVVAVARSKIQGANMQDVMADMERALAAARVIEP